MNRIVTLSIGVLAIVVFSGCATNQPMMDRLGRMETMQQTDLSESKAEFESMKREIGIIRERLDAISKAQADLMTAMDRQNELIQNTIEMMKYAPSVQTQEAKPADPARYSLPEPSESIPGDEPDQRPEVVYQTAYNDYIKRNYDLAILEFQNFLAAFQDSDLADNAQYWIGECYYSQQRYGEALAEFNKVIEKYPDGDKYIPALLKKGLCMIESGNAAGGRRVLEQLISDYPYSNEARIAQDRLANP
ncbi:MAG TPA: tol-pal system protein YbgF [bacterium]|nr:tol-pal system protein YbgF [bacterium]